MSVPLWIQQTIKISNPNWKWKIKEKNDKKNGWILTLFKRHFIHILSLIILFYFICVSIVSLYSCHHHNMTTNVCSIVIYIYNVYSVLVCFSFGFYVGSSTRTSMWMRFFFISKSFLIWKWSEQSFFFLLRSYEKKKPTSRPYAKYIEHIVYVLRSTLTMEWSDLFRCMIAIIRQKVDFHTNQATYHDIVQPHQHLLTKFSLAF